MCSGASRPSPLFVGVASPARCSFYAAKVRALAVWRDNELLRLLAFPLLRTLRLILPRGSRLSDGDGSVGVDNLHRASIDNPELRGKRRSGDSSGSD